MRLPEPIATMMREHQTLLALLNDLSNIAALGSGPDTNVLAELVGKFLQSLEAHVHKEEDILFPSVRAALGNEADALEIIDDEHAAVVKLRIQFSDLAARLQKNGTRAPENLRRLAELTNLAGDILPAHIFKEDNVLYPLASQIISRQKLSELAIAAGSGSRAE
ncbi:MAG: hemerythrin domain-containing protein [Armatimonadetes bacterium]|nr:hemerythrin domain-containing protein [Armatimonadota bacterium]